MVLVVLLQIGAKDLTVLLAIVGLEPLDIWVKHLGRNSYR